MRALLIVILLAACGWAGYWYIGSSGLKSALTNWFEARRAEGWQAEYSDLSVRGFPNRFDASFTDLALADPHTGLAWEMPFFQLLMLSYKPNHIIAVWPNEQTVGSPEGRLEVLSDDMRASLILQAGTDLRVERTTLTAEQLQLRAEGVDAPTRIDKFALAGTLTDASEMPTYHLGLSAADVTLTDSWLKLLDPRGTLPQVLAGAKVDMTVGFDRYWDRHALEDRRPQPRQISLRLAEARWGDMLLQATGDLSVDENGVPSGELTIKAENWRQMLELIRASGQLSAPVVNMIESGLQLLAKMSGNSNSLDAPLTLKGGQIRVGFLPIGPAPYIWIR